MTSPTIELLSAEQDHAQPHTLVLDNSADAQTASLEAVTCVKLHFPKFTDGRAYSQAFVLRRRGFQGDIRATGDVLVDQLLQMQRSGFTSAVLRADQDASLAARLLTQFDGFYQGDTRQRNPHFQAA